jgi:hypothetical protein
MLHFIASNAATCVISLALALAIGAVVVRGVRKLRRGGGCSCDCGACGGACGGASAASKIADARGERVPL